MHAKTLDEPLASLTIRHVMARALLMAIAVGVRPLLQMRPHGCEPCPTSTRSATRPAWCSVCVVR
jgi:hypothetical protein